MVDGVILSLPFLLQTSGDFVDEFGEGDQLGQRVWLLIGPTWSWFLVSIGTNRSKF